MLHVEQWDLRSRIEMTGAGLPVPCARDGDVGAGLAGALRGFFACSFIGWSLGLEERKLIYIKQRESNGKTGC
jgi:hypothetical protein